MKVKKITALCCAVAMITAAVPVTASAGSDWDYRIVCDSLSGVNIRSGASTDSEIIGYLPTGGVADIVEWGSEWTLVVSNGVQGYVRNDNIATGDAAAELASVYGYAGIKTYWDGVPLYSEPDGSSEVIGYAAAYTEYVVASEYNYWYGVYLSDGTAAYLPKEDVLETTVLEKATAVASSGSYESYDTADSAASSYESSYDTDASYEDTSYDDTSYEDSSYDTSYDTSYETEAPATTETTTTTTTTATTTSASSSDLDLLAALIYCEAGATSYDGMVAVGAVVMNRMASSSFPSTLSGVIYQSGQFTPASSGALASALANGVPSSCYTAAQAALNGEDPTGGCLYFNNGRGTGTVIGGNQFY